MKQILQDLRSGRTSLADMPAPGAAPGRLLVQTSRSLISPGTERMLVDFGRAGWLGKARDQPEKVRQVLEKFRTDGLQPTVDAIRRKLDQPITLGYCNVGTVIELGQGVEGFSIGDRVASNGTHAEVVNVPVNLCAKVPHPVTDEMAAFSALGAIALQGVRLAQPTLGETLVVSGLGVIGLLTVQLLRANGCRVLGIDVDEPRLDLARQFGADVVDLAAGQDPIAAADVFSRGRGVDGVIITASSKSDDLVHQAAQACRKRGRIVLVGVAGLHLRRADFYEKELTFQVSCSYGPGRYDQAYEGKGLDYPFGLVRWTEQRNMEAVLDMMADGRLDVTPLISHRFALDAAARAYEVVAGKEPSLGILLEYPTSTRRAASVPEVRTRTKELFTRTVALRQPPARTRTPGVAFIGAGNYATAVLAPAFRETGAELRAIVSSGGVRAVHAGKRHGFGSASTDTDSVLADPLVHAVVVATRHDSHASLVTKALAAGKHVFVEKPLAMSQGEISAIEEAWTTASASGHPLHVMVGFNRRFAPHVIRIKRLLDATAGAKAFVMTVNAGAIPATHWAQDPDVGGGRILGEACHFIDLLRFLTGHQVISHSAARMEGPSADTVTIQLTFADGSIGTIHYFANGSKRFPKERLDVFGAGRVLQLENFRKLTGFGWPGFHRLHLWRQDKGQQACARAFVESLRTGGPPPIPFSEVLEVSRLTVDIADSIR